jgi:hypothetical protein
VRSYLNFGVCLLHLLFLLLLLFAPQLNFKNKEKRPLIVRECTVAAVVKETKMAPKAKPTPAKVLPASHPKPASRPVAKKIDTPAPAPQKQKEARQNRALSNLAKELEKSIAQIERSAPEKSPTTKTALKLQIDMNEKQESDYVASLTHYLHTALHLPDFGAVKMELTVREDGSIAKLLVLKAESEENRKYLEKHIPLLHFPPLQGEYAKNNTHAFVLTFCNEL